MTEFDAVYFDGISSARMPVRARADGGKLCISGAGVEFEVALADVTVDAPIADAPRTFELPGGARLRTADLAAVNILFPRANLFEAWVRQFELHWGMAIASVVIVGIVAWWCVVYGIPLVANAAAHAIPLKVETGLGDQTLAALDSSFCTPSKLDDARKKSIRNQFGGLTAGDATTYDLEFRACPRIGANAYALPGGAIVVLDDLVGLAADDREVAAVLAHELGHVHHRHALRLALQASGVAALISVLAGDAMSITSIAVLLPTMLLQSSYSREFETEADTFGFERMKSVGLPPALFADMMELLEKKRQAKEGTPAALDYLSTHPATAERIKRAREYR